MGNFYTNITLRGPSQDQVVEVLEGQDRTAYVSPTVNGCTVVFDRDCEEQDVALLQALAVVLSRRLRCPALAVLNHDDDILAYWLYENSNRLDQYDSTPGYFEGDEADPEGGDAAVLCRAFGITDPAQIVEVEDILCASQMDDDGYIFAVDRHADLADALGLPPFVAGAGYTYIEQGDAPEDLDLDSLVHVGEE